MASLMPLQWEDIVSRSSTHNAKIQSNMSLQNERDLNRKVDSIYSDQPLCDIFSIPILSSIQLCKPFYRDKGSALLIWRIGWVTVVYRYILCNANLSLKTDREASVVNLTSKAIKSHPITQNVRLMEIGGWVENTSFSRAGFTTSNNWSSVRNSRLLPHWQKEDI